jgi:hypothetical protein
MAGSHAPITGPVQAPTDIHHQVDRIQHCLADRKPLLEHRLEFIDQVREVEQKHRRRFLLGLTHLSRLVKVPTRILVVFEEDLDPGGRNDLVGDEREEIAEPPDLPLEPIQVLRRVRRDRHERFGVELVPLFVGIGTPLVSGPPTAVRGLGNIGSHGPIDPATALAGAEKFLGAGYKEIYPGIYRSADGLRQFRMTARDLLPTHGNIGPHVHFEIPNPSGGPPLENLHLPITP